MYVKENSEFCPDIFVWINFELKKNNIEERRNLSVKEPLNPLSELAFFCLSS